MAEQLRSDTRDAETNTLSPATVPDKIVGTVTCYVTKEVCLYMILKYKALGDECWKFLTARREGAGRYSPRTIMNLSRVSIC